MSLPVTDPTGPTSRKRRADDAPHEDELSPKTPLLMSNKAPSTTPTRPVHVEYDVSEKPVGRGAYSYVFKAWPRNCRQVGPFFAIKKQGARVYTDFEHKTTVTSTVAREIEALSALREGPHIVPFVQAYTENHNTYIIMRYMPQTLLSILSQHRAQKKPVEISDIRHFIRQLCQGLRYAHERHFIHRDIKPANLLVDDQKVLYLADWGMSRNIGPDGNVPLSPDVVTRWYRPPELLLGYISYGPEIDMWSVGCILAEMLTGEVLFRGQSDAEQLQCIVKALGTPTPEELSPKLTTLSFSTPFTPRTSLGHRLTSIPEAQDLIDRLLSYKPTSRPSAQQALEHPFLKLQETT